MKAREIVLSGVFAALTAVGAQISVPLGPVPFTFQVLMVFLSGLVLGAKLGTLSQVIYLLLGALGLPVFARFSGGIIHIYGPTGGYLLAFPIAAFISGYFSEKTKSSWGKLGGCLLGLGIIYILGWVRLGIWLDMDFKKAFYLGVAPFIVFDIIKALIALVISERIKNVVR
ncbi:MAG: biotin transport system substrate-specific component [Pyrococcus sp.]|uniref:biotin transporter BioY n=1 Tax=Pyrococcus sp. TaxID=33866 RepID=UPI00258F7F03|nr:biotin transporter BioY [Pyrococcus sp.]MDK2870188.1 biotin transport system substrate-specific component [Pyrococcus sp.]